jgi:diguanylate cyclase (GGDEF)-like protein
VSHIKQDRQFATEPYSVMAEDVAALRDALAAAEADNRALRIALAEMERVATLDALTSIANRRHFIAEINRRLARIRRYGDEVAVIFADVNGMKAINDAHGHAAGDAVLIEVADRLQRHVRETDVVARLGGDEFGILLDNMPAAEAHKKVAFLRSLIMNQPILFDGKAMQPTTAFGVTMVGPDDDEQTALARADAAMYQDKALQSISPSTPA